MTTVLSLLIFLMGAVRCQKPPYCSANKFEIGKHHTNTQSIYTLFPFLRFTFLDLQASEI